MVQFCQAAVEVTLNLYSIGTMFESRTTTLAMLGRGEFKVPPDYSKHPGQHLDYATNASFQLLSNSPLTNTVSHDSITV